MYRMGQGALDQQISRTVAAIGHGKHLAKVEAHLADELPRLRSRIAKLAAAEEADGTERLSLGDLWSLLRGTSMRDQLTASIHQADRIILTIALEEELKFVCARRDEIAAERKTVAGAAEILAELLDQKEAWLASTKAPGNAALLELGRVRGIWQTLDGCLLAAFRVAEDAQRQILLASNYFEDAHDPRSRRRASGINSGSKQGQLQQASVHAGMANIHCSSLNVELDAVTEASEELAVDLESVLVQRAVKNSHRVSGPDLRRDSDWIFAVLSAIASLRRDIKTRLSNLASQRRGLLGG